MLEIMYDVSISARLTTTTTKEGWWSVGDHVRCEGGMVEYWIMYDVSISARLTTTTTKEGWWSVGDHVRCIHLSTVNYNYDEGGMVECWRSCTMIHPTL